MKPWFVAFLIPIIKSTNCGQFQDTDLTSLNKTFHLTDRIHTLCYLLDHQTAIFKILLDYFRVFSQSQRHLKFYLSPLMKILISLFPCIFQSLTYHSLRFAKGGNAIQLVSVGFLEQYNKHALIFRVCRSFRPIIVFNGLFSSKS